MLSNRLPLVRLGWLPTRLQLGIGVLRKRLRLVRLGWIPTRLQLGDAVTRLLRSPASLPSGGTLVCALSFVVRLQMLLRLGVRAVTPLITTLDRSRLPGQIFQISFLGRSFSYTSQGHEKVILVLRRVMLEKNGHDHFLKYIYINGHVVV